VKSGFVSVVGRPNVGKSTLVNALVGTKVAITSPRPQTTTRNTVRGIVDGEDFQVVLVDTPGLHRPRTALGERLNRLVEGSLAEADVVLFVLDATQEIGPGDRRIAERLTSAGTPTIVISNKIDVAGSDEITEQLAEAGEWDFVAYVPVSALDGKNLQPILTELEALLPEGPAYFPVGTKTDQPEELLFSELIREKFLARLREELPHSLAVVIEETEEQDNGVLRISARLIVERDSQKGIIIGKGGSLIREAGTEARLEIETLLGTKVFLDLRARVEKDWQQRPGMIARLGL